MTEPANACLRRPVKSRKIKIFVLERSSFFILLCTFRSGAMCSVWHSCTLAPWCSG